MSKDDSRFFRGQQGLAKDAKHRLASLPKPPPWRAFSTESQETRARAFKPSDALVKIVNAALLLRRPILLEGDPGSGKTSLAYSVAEELGLPGPFRWSITSRTSLMDGLYLYDALARLRDSQMANASKDAEDIGRYLRLGPVGMAFAVTSFQRPAVLLIDEIDKSDMDLPSDLLHLFEEGGFPIPELERLENNKIIEVLPCRSSGSGEFAKGVSAAKRIPVHSGNVSCSGEFPLVIMTSNQGRDFPAPFLRRCLRVTTKPISTQAELLAAAKEHLKAYAPEIEKEDAGVKALIAHFVRQGEKSIQSFDQLLNALVLQLKGRATFASDLEPSRSPDGDLLDAVWASLGTRQQ